MLRSTAGWLPKQMSLSADEAVKIIEKITDALLDDEVRAAAPLLC